MAIRSKLKNIARHLLGRKQTTSQPSTVPVEEPTVVPSKSAKPKSTQETVSVIKDTVEDVDVSVPAPASPPASPSTPTPAPVSQDKVARHRERTRRGLLQKTIDVGGMIELGPLHEHSERRFFVGHKAFSDMMEDLVREELLIFDWDAQEATITEAGREYLRSSE